MRIARYEAHGDIHYGVVDGDNVTAIDGNPFGDFTVSDHVHKLSDVKLLAPVVPGKILAMGLNYTSHIGDRPAPEYPMIFHKTPTSVIGPEDTIIRPKEVQRFDAEGEMVVVIKDTCRYVSKDDALNHVLGYATLRQRCLRPRLAAQGPQREQLGLVARQVSRHLLSYGPVD